VLLTGTHNITRHADMETDTGVDGVRGLFVHYTSKCNQRLANNYTQQLFATFSRNKRISSCLFVRLCFCLSVRSKQHDPHWMDFVIILHASKSCLFFSVLYVYDVTAAQTRPSPSKSFQVRYACFTLPSLIKCN